MIPFIQPQPSSPQVANAPFWGAANLLSLRHTQQGSVQRLWPPLQPTLQHTGALTDFQKQLY